MAFTLKSGLELLLRVLAVDVPVDALNFLLVQLSVLAWCRDLLILRFGAKKSALRHAHRQSLVLSVRVEVRS